MTVTPASIGASLTANLKNATIIETYYVDNIIAKLDAVGQLVDELNPCAIIQEIVNEVFAYIQARINALEQQIEALAIVQFLLEIPSDLEKALKWIENAITAVIKPLYQAYLTAIAQLTALAAAITRLTAAIMNAASQIKGGCVPTIPAISITIPTPFTPPAPPSGGGS